MQNPQPIDRAHASTVQDDCRFGITSCTVTIHDAAEDFSQC